MTDARRAQVDGAPPRSAAATLIALGASNLTRLALPLLDAARANANGPVHAHMALGRGRSFGLHSRLLGRGLPGIDACGLWHALAEHRPRGATALVTDVGNDLLYHVPVPRILEWVEGALVRLAPHTRRRFVVGLPIDGIRRLSRWRFALVRRVLVPGCRLTLPQAIAGAEQLDAGLARLAARHDARFVPPRPDWYGFDPIHVRRTRWREAAAAWLGGEPVPATGARFDGPAARLRFCFAAPARRSWFGLRSTTTQPARRWKDGSTLSLW